MNEGHLGYSRIAAYFLFSAAASKGFYRMKKLTMILFLSACAPAVVENDPGGSLNDRLSMLEELDGRQVEIAGDCASACTLFLSLENVCLRPNARLHFHGPTASQALFLPIMEHRPDLNHRNIELMAQHYPPAISDWFLSGPAYLTGSNFETLTATQVVEMSNGKIEWCE